jgi:hypothetical protein
MGVEHAGNRPLLFGHTQFITDTFDLLTYRQLEVKMNLT